MLNELDTVSILQRRLSVHRRTVEVLELQRAQFGAFTPAYIWHQFDEARAEIARIKDELRALGSAVVDHFGDVEPAVADPPALQPNIEQTALLSVYQRMVADQVRYVSLAGLSHWSHFSLQLADVYVERAPVPVSTNTPILPNSAPSSSPASLADLISRNGARVMLEGAAGSGKTTYLRMLALACTDPAASADAAASWPDPAPLPVLLTANEIALALARINAAPEEQNMPTLEAFWGAIEEWLQFSNLKALVPTIRQLFERGGCIVLIDGMDDLPPTASQRAFVAALGLFVARYPDNRYVVTCRQLPAGVLAPLASFARFRFTPLDQPLVDELMTRWYMAVADHAGLLMAEDVTRRIATLRGVLHGDERFKELIANPLTLVLCILAHAESHVLPQERRVVLRRLAEIMLMGSDHSQLSHAPSLAQAVGVDLALSTDQWLQLIEPLALALQSRLPANREQLAKLSQAEAVALLAKGLAAHGVEPHHATSQVIPALLLWCSRHGLLAKTGANFYTMPQQQVREYLSARAMAGRPDFPARAYALRRDQRWHETLLHALHELSRSATPHIARLLIRLLLHPPAPEEDPRSNDLLLAAESLVDIGARSQSDRALRREVQERLVAFMHMDEQPLERRVQAGMLLGALGDLRVAGPIAPLAQVGAGRFLLGTADGYDDEGPPQWVTTPAFAIGVYPVTNQEYAVFLAASPLHTPPRYWHDPRFNNPACPVVGVTWHDAVAYCAWHTEKLRSAGTLPYGRVIRLPQEIEWEKAASWDASTQTKRRYPWGNDWADGRSNLVEGRGAWMTTPVGCYPEGISAYGLHDCIGNVWEWTASDYHSYPGADVAFEESSYTLRGSSCASTPTHARCTYRSRLPASYWRYHLGFRIVLGAPLDRPAAPPVP